MSDTSVATIADMLNELSLDDIKAVLRTKSIKGVRNSFSCCPIAVYFGTHGKTVHIYRGTVCYEYGSKGCTGWHELSPSVDKFILQFDVGMFPEFEAEIEVS
jgi:hypothetical protein